MTERKDIASFAQCELYTEGKERFAKFFLLDGSWNSNGWRVPYWNIEPYLETFINQPYISTPNLDHFGAEEDMPVDQVLREQEKYRVGNIVKTGMDHSRKQAYAIVKITNDDVWNELLAGKAIYVSPGITGQAQVFRDGSILYTGAWHGLHLARVQEPAFGTMSAFMRQTCEGTEGECMNKLMSVAHAKAKDFEQRTSFASCSCGGKCAKCKSSLSIAKGQSSSGMAGNDSNAEAEQLKTQVAQLTAQLKTANDKNADLEQKLKTAQSEKEQIDGRLKDLESKFAKMESDEKARIAEEIVKLKVASKILAQKDADAEKAALAKLDRAILDRELVTVKAYSSRIESYEKQSMSPLQKAGREVIATASAKSGAEDLTVDTLRREGWF